MNDFTKEELEELSGALSYWINRNQPESEDLIILFKKIQSMIDNYCEHKWTSVGNHPWLHCIKCKANFNHE